MITLRKDRARLAAALAAAALFGCARGEQASQRADSTARNLTLAPAETTAAMRDVPAPEPQPARPAPERKASVPARKPVAKPATPATPTTPSTLTLAAGTKLSLSVTDTISTRSAKPGDGFTATVSEDVRDASGRVVIPAGASVCGTIVAAAPAPNPRSAGPPRIRHDDPAGSRSGNRIDVRLVTPDLDLVAHCRQRVDDPRRKPVALQENDVRQRLVVEPGRGHGVSQRHALVDYVAHDLVDCGRDARPARRAEDQIEATLGVQDDGRRHRRQHSLPWGDGVRLALNQPEQVRLARRRGEIVHFVIEQEARPRYGDRASEIIVQRRRAGHGVPGRDRKSVV